MQGAVSTELFWWLPELSIHSMQQQILLLGSFDYFKPGWRSSFFLECLKGGGKWQHKSMKFSRHFTAWNVTTCASHQDHLSYGGFVFLDISVDLYDHATERHKRFYHMVVSSKPGTFQKSCYDMSLPFNVLQRRQTFLIFRGSDFRID